MGKYAAKLILGCMSQSCKQHVMPWYCETKQPNFTNLLQVAGEQGAHLSLQMTLSIIGSTRNGLIPEAFSGSTQHNSTLAVCLNVCTKCGPFLKVSSTIISVGLCSTKIIETLQWTQMQRVEHMSDGCKHCSYHCNEHAGQDLKVFWYFVQDAP